MRWKSILRLNGGIRDMTKKYLNISFLCFVVCLCLTWSVCAQSIVTGGIAGTVTDPTGAVVTGAQLTLRNGATGEQVMATSSASGDYVFALLKPGQYTLSATKEGFKTSTRSVTVMLGTTVSVAFALEVGSAATTVEVSGDQGGQLQTE